MAATAVESNRAGTGLGIREVDVVGSAGTRVVWEPVVQGVVEQATRAYESLASAQRERVREEALLASAASRATLVEVMRSARDFAGAARLLESRGDDVAAAPLYEQAGELRPAAEAWLRAGEHARAAAAFERGGVLELALELYQSQQALESVARVLTRLRRPGEAALVYRALGNTHAELESLRAVAAEDAGRRDTVLRMSALLDARGDTWRALVLLADAVRESPDAELHAEQARLLRQLGLASPAEGAVAAERTPAPPDGYEYLKAIPIFGELPLEDMKDLYRVARPVVVPEGVVVMEKGARGTGLLVLLEGIVDVYAGPGPDARRLNTLGQGAYLGEISLILDGPTSAQVRARTAVRALRVTHLDFQSYLDTHPAAALRIYRLFTQNLAERVRALSA
ncbi:cyclic nucleotide-binding domain-containing protein [Corallococcus sp. H22C18031201]|uniref:cyclic nucleotide-binding domain-containing protein n=1 Tax=Citreicoccus inhibens TaxID=2849499 RepID=UPI000E709FBB|nr:cyclic nucleotide-binding domain-containing protein [Citreicoccus inhibens]MBU8900160.1 cyclic nucleotide-binding domain-containing protein [Citreicoccus inhibens]RJS21797.1 cyclic nucleotide-binding domain-containing protein [Corallococcus sp. H22C18031201]